MIAKLTVFLFFVTYLDAVEFDNYSSPINGYMNFFKHKIQSSHVVQHFVNKTTNSPNTTDISITTRKRLDKIACKSLTAYFKGTFQRPNDSSHSFEAEFQIKIESTVSGVTNFIIKHWRRLDCQDCGKMLFKMGLDKPTLCYVDSMQCKSVNSGLLRNFSILVSPTLHDPYFYNILDFDYMTFNMLFMLENVVGKCANKQVSHFPWDNPVDQSKFDYCICCDSEYDPDPLLNCPVSSWSNGVTETLPTTTDISHTDLSTPPPDLTPRNLTCKSIVAYYNGRFLNQKNPSLPFNTEFQFRLTANDQDQLNYFTVDHWNKITPTKPIPNFKPSPIEFNYDPENDLLCIVIGNLCGIPYVNQTSQGFYVKLLYGVSHSTYTHYYLTLFPSFFNSFTLTNTIEGCTKNQVQPLDPEVPNSTLYEYCICCGDKYNPHPSLNCPKNPWA